MSDLLGISGVQTRVSQIQSLLDPGSATSTSTADFQSILSELTASDLTSVGLTGSDGQVNAQDLISSAEKYIGTPYVWGGESLSEGGLDCSGLVVRSLADLGITDIPRTAAQQQTLGTQVDSLTEAIPGDLLFFDNGRHVAIYLGGNQMIEAPSPGGAVRETDVWETPTSIRRVLPQASTTLSDTAAAQRLVLNLLQGVSS